MTASAVFFACLGISIRLAARELHPFEIVFFRNALSVVFLLPLLYRSGAASLRTGRFGLHAGRAFTGLAAMMMWFTAVTLMPLAEATAISFTSPLFASLGAALFLGEIFHMRRLMAILIGFLGMLIILRPGAETLSPPFFLALGGALLVALGALQVKVLSGTEAPNTIVIYMNVLTAPLSLISALFVWAWPSPLTWAFLVGVGASATLGHLCYTRAFAVADASAVFPYDYIRLPVIAVLAFLIFDQVPDIWTWAGGAVIFASSVYISRREAQVAAREGKQAPSPAAPIDPA